MKLEQWINKYKDFDFEADQIENSKCPSFNNACSQLKTILQNELGKDNFKIVNYSPNWYSCSFFVRQEISSDCPHYCYVSFGDVRNNKNWVDDVLIRTAQNTNDYTGGTNHKCSMSDIIDATKSICKDGYYSSLGNLR